LTVHSFNALQANDSYAKIHGTDYFYEQTASTTQFDARLSYILNHNHSSLGKPRKELDDYFFAVEAENEAMIGKGADYIAAHASW
jgi:mannan endo-1,4-beta-mannosidase